MTPDSRYDVSGLVEAQFEPGSRKRVLKNRLGITRKSEMDNAELESLDSATVSLIHQYGPGHRFTAADLKHMHKVWLGGIYQWAGQYRQVNVGKGGFMFAAAGFVPNLMKDFENGPQMRHTPCVYDSRDRIIEAIAEVHVELLLIHPFREGNGRLARMFAGLMASQSNFTMLDFTGLKGKKKEEYFAAVRAGLDRDYRPMQDIMDYVIKRTLRVSGGQPSFPDSV